jgi:hypothetical protein
MASEGEAADMAAAAIASAKASMDRINDLLTPQSAAPAAAPSAPPPGLTAEQEVQWWNDKIAKLSSDADQKGGIVSTNKSNSGGGGGSIGAKGSASASFKDTGSKDSSSSRMAPRGMTSDQEADWLNQRMSRLTSSSSSESKRDSSAKDCK